MTTPTPPPASAPHSPLPWMINPRMKGDIIEKESGTIVAENLFYLDARLIVRAVNSHEKLLAALQRLVEWADCGCDPSHKSLTAARAVLAAATEGTL